MELISPYDHENQSPKKHENYAQDKQIIIIDSDSESDRSENLINPSNDTLDEALDVLHRLPFLRNLDIIYTLLPYFNNATLFQIELIKQFPFFAPFILLITDPANQELTDLTNWCGILFSQYRITHANMKYYTDETNNYQDDCIRLIYEVNFGCPCPFDKLEYAKNFIFDVIDNIRYGEDEIDADLVF
ncbi:hypothetical protein TRFO_38399 [Tritrichomonas foetus]|uniref:Uncharacterized protein n=1 Tax=Tritrichomonas foetus TaxID=1144522 RepID=A0A1J4JE16_9EUKA|nr:hypothetical protein TRFO_38399 [Tritrichomonas foetus]|eukprot:OHS95500.1 hypothetical protein TRFO_38399 [Tritrichomonas foetus]